MSKIYARFKVTITVLMVAVVSVLLAQTFYLMTLLTDGVDNVIQLYKSNMVVSNTVLIGTFLMVLLVIDYIRYHIFGDKEEEKENN